MAIKKRKKRNLLEEAGVEIVPYDGGDGQDAVSNEEDAVLDTLFDSDAAHDVMSGIGRVKGRIIIDLEMSWPEPPYQNEEQVFEQAKAYLLKSLAHHKYLSFTGLNVRGQITERTS